MRSTRFVTEIPATDLTAAERGSEIDRLAAEQKEDDTNRIKGESFGEACDRTLSLEAFSNPSPFSSAKLVDFLISDGRVETYKPVNGDADTSLGDRLVAAMSQLTAESQDLLNALFWERATERALAARLGISKTGVRIRKDKAVAELRRLLLAVPASETAAAV